MAQEFAPMVCGMVLIAGGAFWHEVAARDTVRKALAILLCACGVYIIAMTEVRMGFGWSMDLAVVCSYSGSAAFIALIPANALRKRRAGAVLATVGSAVANWRSMGILVVVVPLGILSVVMQLMYEHKPNSVLMTGQALIFVVIGLNALLMARSPWRLADGGILGLNLFVPWEQVISYNWRDSDRLEIATKPGQRPRRLIVAVAPEARERTISILSSKVPACC